MSALAESAEGRGPHAAAALRWAAGQAWPAHLSGPERPSVSDVLRVWADLAEAEQPVRRYGQEAE